MEGALVLAEAEQLALSQHPAIIEAQARIQAAQGQWLQAGLYPNPTVGYSGQQLGSRGLAEQDGVVMQGELVLGGKLRLNRAVAEQQIVQAEMEFAGRQLRVLTNVRKSFYEVLVAQRRTDLNDQLVSVGAKGLQAAETLFQAKEVGRADVLQARIEAQQSRILQFNARNRSAAAWRELAAAMGREDLGSRPVEGDVSDDGRDYEWEPMRQRLLGSSPELAVALANAQRAQAMLARARVEPIPNLTIQGIIQRDAAISSTDGAIQATMPIPVFNRNQGNIRAAEGEWIAAEQAVRRLELDLQSRLAPVYERYRNAKQQVERYREEILPNAKETLDLVQASYEAGESNYLALLTAQRTYFQTNLAYLDGLRELWSAIWEMEGLLVNP
jgi:cobalt-zinc-cadmium efflux system outer membrane protein